MVALFLQSLKADTFTAFILPYSTYPDINKHIRACTTVLSNIHQYSPTLMITD